ncbi:hypothetical protein SPRG_10993 [Saprolegnia parasitica CBS 223.65]|uniref:RNA helicase n=1 Tax=Saprolegnia parasitica (strain CBS 223.65) TaxID=695850 RepID=A0A067BWQ8_SAPPC|nr:hypothetical protein SPRG_10993 [Saprolegnia parasitica CBS 223.65]KDO22678.1 hypothetical protein SPRG_10993 [Saprolegnia parasitica CBS 223.65]|eukprot:XP_012206594.1 hypothetical protein SPRG_10993 [Saprolegnia parasitica CBS 223.65]
MLQQLDLAADAEARLQELLAPTLRLPSTQDQFRTGRRTLKKIEKAYDTLTALGVPFALIEEGLAHANDAAGALRYICLYHSSSDLPPRFRANVPKPPADDAVLEVVAAPPRPMDLDAAIATPVVAAPIIDAASLAETQAKEDADRAKEWTRRYMEAQANSDKEDDEDDESQLSPEARMWKLEVACAKSVVDAQRAKRDGGDAKRWNAEIARLRREMRELELYVDRAKMAPVPTFELDDAATAPPPATAATATTSADNDDDDNDDDDDDDEGGGLFGMLEESAPVAAIVPTAAVVTSVLAPIDTNIGGKWTGKSPRVQLQDYCRKQKWPTPAFTQDKTAGKFSFSVSLTPSAKAKSKAVAKVVSLPGVLYATMDGAKDAVATRALYELAPHLPLHRGFPPFFRDMWLDWERVKDDAKAAAQSASRSSKDAIVQALFRLCKDESAVDASDKTTVRTTPPPPVPAVVLDSWDDDDDEDAASGAVANDWEAAVALPVTPLVDERLRAQWRDRVQSAKYQSFVASRNALPMAAYRTQIRDALQSHSVVLISGETGCGKSTQVPHFLLDDLLSAGHASGSIICTQPRRIAAIGVAERVANEVGEVVGKGYVGYSIRLEQRKSAQCKLLFCTTGILLRQLQSNMHLDGVSHVIVDEIHERDVQSDVLLALLRRLLRRGAQLKIVLMSATLNAAQFQRYFDDCPLLQVPGRLFPVEVRYLEDVLEATGHIVHDGSKYCKPDGHFTQQSKVSVSSRGGNVNQVTLSWSTRDVAPTSWADDSGLDAVDGYSARTREMLAKIDAAVINYELIEDLVAHILSSPDHDGAILVFLSGRGEIRALLEQLDGNREIATRCVLLPLHASLSSSEQQRIFQSYPRKTKVIVSTNLAETSLTIDDVTVVIDAGRVKQMRHDVKTQTSSLTEVWIAKANANQRAGRAGRVRPGVCYRLYPKDTFEYELQAQPVAEIHRAPLTSLALQLHTLVGQDAPSFWADLLESPADQAILDATNELSQLGAVTPQQTLTALGKHLAALPLDVRVGKLLLFGAIFQCPGPIAIIAAILETKSPFAVPFGSERDAKAKRALFESASQSDLLTDLAAYDAWQRSTDRAGFCRRNYLHPAALEEIRKLAASFEQLLVQLEFLPRDYAKQQGRSNGLANDEAVVAAVVASGLYPNVVDVQVDATSGVVRFWEKKKQVHLHPSSVNHGRKTFLTPYLGYHIKLQTSRVYVPVSSSITPYALALFGGAVDVDVLQPAPALVVDGWLSIPASARTAMLVLELRKCLADLLQRKIDAPGCDDALAKDAIEAMALLWKNELEQVTCSS